MDLLLVAGLEVAAGGAAAAGLGAGAAARSAPCPRPAPTPPAAPQPPPRLNTFMWNPPMAAAARAASWPAEPHPPSPPRPKPPPPAAGGIMIPAAAAGCMFSQPPPPPPAAHPGTTAAAAADAALALKALLGSLGTVRGPHHPCVFMRVACAAACAFRRAALFLSLSPLQLKQPERVHEEQGLPFLQSGQSAACVCGCGVQREPRLCMMNR